MDVSIYRLRLRDILTVCVLALLCLGVIMVQSAAMKVTGNVGWSWTELGIKHIRFAAFAIIAFFVVGHVDYVRLLKPNSGVWRQPVTWMLIMATFACLIVLVPHIGIERNGARRWLPLGP